MDSPPPMTARRGLVALAALGLALVAPIPTSAAGAHPAAAEVDCQRPSPPEDAVATRAGDPGTHRITLLTGDVVALHTTAKGRQAAWVVDAVDERRPAQIYELDGEVHVVPAEAAPYVASGALDPNLFNVTLLARHGYDDASTGELPLLIEASDRARTSAPPAAPAGTDEVRELDSIDTVVVAADKAELRSTWEEIRGARVASSTGTAARLADDTRVWLNGKVETTLDESVPQIGAPYAWQRGYDGDGTTVAVLDTGYDPDHPDLGERVVDAADFTGGESGGAVDRVGHGTHVAATVAGTGAASDGAQKGVAPAADLLIGKVLADNGEGTFDQIIAGMEWAVANDADVVNMSLGTPWASDGTDPVSQAVNELTRSSGSLFVVAAGNSGPDGQSVGAPGAADLALTVGAVDKDDRPAPFSSRGPRIGDGAIKPEVTAPGVDIIAARAAGTSLGNLIDEHYTSLNGTSMATPHVAGAAAILAQQHPEWDAAQLKARLVSTSRTMRNQPVTFQGGGRVDVAAAVRTPVSVDQGTVFLGHSPVTSKPVTRTLTYENTSNRPVRLRLSDGVTSTGGSDRVRPELRLSRSLVTVPAYGEASIKVTLVPRRTRAGGYAGNISAQPLGQGRRSAIHTTVGFTMVGKSHTVTVDALDRAGRPASGPVDLWSLDTGTAERSFLVDGTATFDVPEGTYSLVASVEMAGDWFSSTQHTIAGMPELRLDKDRRLRFDARQGRPITISTPREADQNAFDVFWHRSVGDRSISMIAAQGWGNQRRVYTLGSSPVRTGKFILATEWQLAQPLLKATLRGRDGFRLSSPQLASEEVPLVGQHRLPLVDAGAGKPEDFDRVDVSGAAALVSRGTEWGDLQSQADAAAAAGAELLLAYNNTSDPYWDEGVFGEDPLPVYTLDHATGRALLEALADDPTRDLGLTGLRDATYQYELAFAERNRIPHRASYDVGPASLAVVRSDYRQNSKRQIRAESWIPYVDGMGVANSMATVRRGPLVRTEYVSTRGVQWQRFGQPHMCLGEYWTSSAPTKYEPGKRYGQTWWGPLVHPAVPLAPEGAPSAALLGNRYQPVTRYRDAIRISLPHYYFGGSLTSTINEYRGDRSTLVLKREGKVVGTSNWPTVQYTVPAGRAEYELSLEAVNGRDNWSDTSVRTSTAWRFDSARTDRSGNVLPLVQVGYALDADTYNAMPAGASYPLDLVPGYQPGGSGPGRFTARVEVSFDDGATWQTAPVKRAGPRLRAAIPATDEPGFASVRVVVTDTDGNRITQQIDRAWRIRP
ncbi:S8 family serine peptidase [Nocardioides speluncae]|uniref:S8 family serine peptidase n=1 Tax=Nocardioides speluncae TaxID=2670337 RepID=UPI00137B8453|nr:S8 family serine peptidase [Nocardioides speluncae]